MANHIAEVLALRDNNGIRAGTISYMFRGRPLTRHYYRNDSTFTLLLHRSPSLPDSVRHRHCTNTEDSPSRNIQWLHVEDTLTTPGPSLSSPGTQPSRRTATPNPAAALLAGIRSCSDTFLTR